jgi:hypothetical protein
MKEDDCAQAPNTRPQKVLLHIARQKGKWTGRAISYERKEEILFGSIAEFVDWLSNESDKN